MAAFLRPSHGVAALAKFRRRVPYKLNQWPSNSTHSIVLFSLSFSVWLSSAIRLLTLSISFSSTIASIVNVCVVAFHYHCNYFKLVGSGGESGFRRLASYAQQTYGCPSHISISFTIPPITKKHHCCFDVRAVRPCPDESTRLT